MIKFAIPRYAAGDIFDAETPIWDDKNTNPGKNLHRRKKICNFPIFDTL